MLKQILVLFFISIPFSMFSQCGTGACKLCDVTARITSVSGGDIIVGDALISGNVNGGQFKDADQPLEVTSTSCGELELTIVLDFNWDQGSKNNWIHGVSFDASPNWLAAQGIIIPANNGWLFRNGITGVCSGNSYGSGYYWDPPGKACGSNRSNYNGSACVQGHFACEANDNFLVDGDPSDNYGINCDSDCPNFGFELSYCPIDAGSNVEILTFIMTEDGETGGYARSDNCIFTLNFPLKINSAGLQIPDFNPTLCLDSCITLDAGIGCDQYLWSTGDTTNFIEVCPQVTTQYGVTVTAATGCEIIDTINVEVENCCMAESGTFDLMGDTLFICPFDKPLLTVINSQTLPGYQNHIVFINHGVVRASSDTTMVFNPSQYQFNHVNQCDTFTIYSINTHLPLTGSSPPEDISDFTSDCFDIDSLVLIIRDDNPPSSDYPYLDSVLYSDNNILIKYLDTISCISDLPDRIPVIWEDDCILRDTTFINENKLIPCELSYYLKMWITTDHCSNTTVIRNWTTLLPDTLTFDLIPTNEYCLGENNGQIDVININQSGTLWSLNDGPFINETHFENLSPGQHIISGQNSCGCIYSDTIIIEQGTNINIELLDTICNNNGTLGVPDDDFYVVSVIVTGTDAEVDSCSFYLDGTFIENIKYDVAFTTNINASQGSSLIKVLDISKPQCQESLFIENLTPCSGICTLDVNIVSEECNDNNTRGFPDDDFYDFSIQVTPTNTISDSFQIILSGVEVYRLPYFETNLITLPADSLSLTLTIKDIKIQDCSTTFTTSELIPCSGVCMLSTQVTEIICDDRNTRRDPSDDKWSFSLTAQLFDGGNTLRIQSGLAFGFFKSGDTITFSDLPIDSPYVNLIVQDSLLLNCDTTFQVLAPSPCSNCLADIYLESEDENCVSNEDGAIWVVLDLDTLISLKVDDKNYENGTPSLSSGDHTISILYGDSCLVDTFFNIGLRPEFTVDIPELYEVTFPNIVTLQVETDLDPNDIFEIDWNPAKFLSCDYCLSSDFSGDTSTQYIISVEDEYGCISYDTTTVLVTKIPKVYFPNIISLHSEINNTIYPIANSNNTRINRMTIYDRWGNLMFLNTGFPPNNPDEGWDGKLNGQEVTSGVYLYQCILTNKDGKEENFVGTITVVK